MGTRSRINYTQVKLTTAPTESWLPDKLTYAAFLRTPEFVDEFEGTTWPGGTSTVSYWWSTPDPERIATEYMDDFVGNPKGFNECAHSKVAPMPPPPWMSFPWGGQTYEVWGEGIPPDPASLAALNASVAPSAEALSDFAWDSVWNATTQIEEQVSLGTFLWELPEVANLKTLIDDWRGLLGGLRDALGTLSGKFLGYQFGVKPLGEDLGKLTEFYRQTMNRIQHLRATRGKTFTVYYERDIVEEGPDVYAGEWRQANSPYEVALLYSNPELGGWTAIHHLTSVIKVENRLEGLDELEALLDAFAAALGLNQPFKILWDHAKLSFVFEWFVNLDNVFASMANNPVASPFRGELAIVDRHWSCKTTIVREACTWRADSTNPTMCRRWKYGEAIGSTYQRRSGLPLGPLISWKGDLSGMQKALLAALAIQGTSTSNAELRAKRLKSLRKRFKRTRGKG